jgi:peptidoglycan/xylan/chitin deacetylase (PgdA/CDA1 family)
MFYIFQRICFLITWLFVFIANLESQKLIVDNSNLFYQIAPLYDFKRSILSLTFDDGYKNQFTIGMPLLKERNLPATFYLITNDINPVTKSLLLSEAWTGFELGSHTSSHANLLNIGNEEVKKELLNSKISLQNWFGVNSGLTMSYPWGNYNGSIELIAKGLYLAARSTDPGFNSLNPDDRYALKTQSFDMHTSASSANNWVDFSIQNHLWLVEMIHGINKSGFSPVDSAVLMEHLDYIKKVEANIWCTTVSSVIKYFDEAKVARIECDLCNDSVDIIRMNDFLDDSVYNQSLSVRMKIPSIWDSVRISNGEKVKTEYNNKNKFIFFNILPDNKSLIIKPISVSDIERESGIKLVFLSVNPFHDNISLSIEVFEKDDVDISLIDMNGKILAHRQERSVSGIINMNFETSHVRNGVYFLRVITGSRGDFIIKKFIKI